MSFWGEVALGEAVYGIVRRVVEFPGYWVCKLLPRYRRQESSDRAEGWAALVFWVVVVAIIVVIENLGS